MGAHKTVCVGGWTWCARGQVPGPPLALSRCPTQSSSGSTQVTSPCLLLFPFPSLVILGG